MEREKVYKIIDGEREFQIEQLHHIRAADRSVSPSGWILFLEYQLNEAKKSAYKGDVTGILIRIRKLAALCVACMEAKDVPARISDRDIEKKL